MSADPTVSSDLPSVPDDLSDALMTSWVTDDILQVVVNIHATQMSFGSSCWLLAQALHFAIIEIESRTLVPYDFLQATFSGHRSKTMREEKKRRAALPPLSEVLKRADDTRGVQEE